MTTRTFALGLALLLAACDGGTTPTDSGPGPTDSGPGPTDSGPGGTDSGTDSGTPPSGCPAMLPDVVIRFDGCTPLAACGGDPTGVWIYDDACVQNPVPDLSTLCATARVESLMGTARGCVTLDGANVTRDVSGEITATVVVPISCTFGMGCAPVETALGVICTLSGGECSCPYQANWGNTTSDTYTISGTTLTTGDGTQYEFCVAGGGLSYQESGAAPEEIGVLALIH